MVPSTPPLHCHQQRLTFLGLCHRISQAVGLRTIKDGPKHEPKTDLEDTAQESSPVATNSTGRLNSLKPFPWKAEAAGPEDELGAARPPCPAAHPPQDNSLSLKHRSTQSRLPEHVPHPSRAPDSPLSMIPCH